MPAHACTCPAPLDTQDRKLRQGPVPGDLVAANQVERGHGCQRTLVCGFGSSLLPLEAVGKFSQNRLQRGSAASQHAGLGCCAHWEVPAAASEYQPYHTVAAPSHSRLMYSWGWLCQCRAVFGKIRAMLPPRCCHTGSKCASKKRQGAAPLGRDGGLHKLSRTVLQGAPHRGWEGLQQQAAAHAPPQAPILPPGLATPGWLAAFLRPCTWAQLQHVLMLGYEVLLAVKVPSIRPWHAWAQVRRQSAILCSYEWCFALYLALPDEPHPALWF